MLNALRRGVATWPVKIVILSLGLVMVWFFSQSDFVASHGPGGMEVDELVQVGGENLPFRQVVDGFNRQLQRSSALFGQSVGVEEGIQTGLLDQSIQQLVQTALERHGAADLGLAISDNGLLAGLRHEAGFQLDGVFDPELVRNTLARSGLSEDMFMERFRDELLREQYIDSMVAGAAVPTALAEPVYAYREERRTAEFVTLPLAGAADIDPPDDAALEAYFDDHASTYEAPAYRAITVIGLSPEDHAETISVSDDEIFAAYESRRDSYTVPERRAVSQAVFSDRAEADKVAARLAEGGDFEPVVTELTGAAPIALGEVTREDLPEAMAGPVFALAEGAISDPLETLLGWHIARVTAITPGETTALAEVQEELGRELALDRARDTLFGVAEEASDILASGAGLEAAADQTGMIRTQIAAMDASGLDKDGAAVDVPPEIVTLAFGDLPVGEISDLTETAGGGFYFLRIDGIDAARPRTLDEVRDRVVADWTESRRVALATAEADRIAAAVRNGDTMRQAITTAGIEPAMTEAFTRTGAASGLPPAVVAALFDADEPDHVARGQTADGIVVARLASVEPPSDDAALAELRDRLRDGVVNDIRTQLLEALQARYEVEVDQETIADILTGKINPYGHHGHAY